MNMNELVVVIFARASMDRTEQGNSEISDSATKIKNNIIHGYAVDPVVGIPTEYMPDYAAWHNEYLKMGHDAFVEAWVRMNKIRKQIYFKLAECWKNNDYDGMVKLMDEYTPVPLVEE